MPQSQCSSTHYSAAQEQDQGNRVARDGRPPDQFEVNDIIPPGLPVDHKHKCLILPFVPPLLTLGSRRTTSNKSSSILSLRYFFGP
jgi:hypothetical protein